MEYVRRIHIDKQVCCFVDFCTLHVVAFVVVNWNNYLVVVRYVVYTVIAVSMMYIFNNV